MEGDERLGLVVAGPWMVRGLRLLGVLLSVALAALIGGAVFGSPGGWPQLRGLLAWLPMVLLLGGVAPSSGLAATPAFPPPELLDQLRQRLTQPALCRPACAELMAASVAVAEGQLAMQLELAVAEPSAVPLPGDPGSWEPFDITVNQRRAAALWRGADGVLWLPLDAGVARIQLSGPLNAAASVTVPFPLQPRYIADREQRLAGGGRAGRAPALQRDRTHSRERCRRGRYRGSLAFEPFVRVIRELRLDLDWTIVTRAERVAPGLGPFTLEIDLLPAESVVSAGVEVRDGKVLAAFAADQPFTTWTSLLPSGDGLRLTAPGDAPWSEVWRLRVSPLWHAEAAGLPETAPLVIEPDFYAPEYYPRPGESLTLSVSRPAASAGETLALDRVDLTTRLGDRASSHDLTFKYRSTRGDRHRIVLPVGAELSRIAIDDRVVPLSADEGQVDLPIAPGEHSVTMEFTSPAAGGLFQTWPASISVPMPVTFG